MYVWGVKSDIYLGFLRRSADKFATGFELMLAKGSKGLVSEEETKMMVMFLKCLRYVLEDSCSSKNQLFGGVAKQPAEKQVP